MTNITNKEKLTQATIKALQGDLENDIDTKETCKDHLTKLFECYAEENHITEFINTLINLVLKFCTVISSKFYLDLSYPPKNLRKQSVN